MIYKFQITSNVFLKTFHLVLDIIISISTGIAVRSRRIHAWISGADCSVAVHLTSIKLVELGQFKVSNIRLNVVINYSSASNNFNLDGNVFR